MNPTDSIPEDITANLPPTRADEPVSLRQDIVDELRDHLQCAVRREQLLGATDHQTVWQRVLVRFGNPTEIARKLYWQAMWSRIMQQRIVVASGIGMLAACVTMAGFMWVMLERQQQQADRQQAWAERQQANFETMLARVSAPSTSYGSLKIQIDRPALVELTGGSLKDPIVVDPEHSEGATGPRVFDFGNLVPGIYTASIKAENTWTREHRIMIRTGETRIEDIQIPHDDLSELNFTTDLPGSNLRGITIEFAPDGITYRQKKNWHRQRFLPECVLLPQRQTTAHTDLIGRVGMRLWYEAKPFSLIAIHARMRPLPDNFPADDAPDANARLIPFELKPGPNSCHVSIPADWISREQADGERRLVLWKPRIREAVIALLSRERSQYSKRIAFLGLESELESLSKTIEDEIMRCKDFEMVDRTIVKEVIATSGTNITASDPDLRSFTVAMTKLNQRFDYVLCAPLQKSKELKLLKVRPDNEYYVVVQQQPVASHTED